MGNDQSKHLKGLEIDKKAAEVTDFWSIYSGEVKNENSLTTSITIFQGEPVVTGQLWSNKSPLQRATRNFMIYRHPSILRFITSWEKGSVHYLATERCKSLNTVLATQNDTQICLGLRNILCALSFLVENANMCHLNVCTTSIYVSSSGAWRIGGFEHLWPKKEITQTLLERSQSYRYKNAIDKDETKRDTTLAIEQYAFGVLCEEILSSRKESLTIPFVDEFRKYCAEHLRNANAKNRPTLSAILTHPYFNQEFIKIHSFLTELPLKGQTEKQTFFTGLVERLREFDEIVVATELMDLILSRMVLLNETAKLCVIPYILQPYDETETSSTSIAPLFSTETFTKFVTPKIQKLFLVRDIQIRLILLEYFPDYMNYFPNNEILSDHILPQLLLGIKDTNDEIVSATLRCLADLVPVLGSAVVIGRNRGRIFADGKPNGLLGKGDSMMDSSGVKWSEARSITPVMNDAGLNTDFVSNSPMLTETASSIASIAITNLQNSNVHLMPERLSPDGGEDVQLNNDQLDVEDDGWSDWETDAPNEIQNQVDAASELTTTETELDINGCEYSVSNGDSSTAPNFQRSLSMNSSNSNANNSNRTESFIKDVKEIQIKSVNTQLDNEIDDFFKDMEPVIATNNSILALLGENSTNPSSLNISMSSRPPEPESKLISVVTDDHSIDQSRFAVKSSTIDADEEIDDNAWGNDDWDD